MTNKGRRQELKQLKFKKRLKNLGLKQKKPKDFICYKDQGKPCSCWMCAGDKYKRSEIKEEERKQLKQWKTQ